MFGVWVKISKFAGILLINWKVTSKQTVPEASIIHFYWHSLMPFENNETLPKWQMTNTPPEIDKYVTHKKQCLTKMAYLARKCPMVICQRLNWVRQFFNLLHDSDSCSWYFKVKFFLLQSDIAFTFLCLVVGEGSSALLEATSENQ